MTDEQVFLELVRNQSPDVDQMYRFSVKDLRRIATHLKCSIFTKGVCSVWHGYITNLHHPKKMAYINFFFKGKKRALHRLLYLNFVGHLTSNEYLKFKCKHQGYCCNIHCLEKHKYLTKRKQSATPAIVNHEAPCCFDQNGDIVITF